MIIKEVEIKLSVPDSSPDRDPLHPIITVCIYQRSFNGHFILLKSVRTAAAVK